MQTPAEFSRDHQPAYVPTTNRPLSGLLTVGVYALVLVVASHRAPNRTAPPDLAARMEPAPQAAHQFQQAPQESAPQAQHPNAPQEARRNAAPNPLRQQEAVASRRSSFLERLFGTQTGAPVPSIAPAPGSDRQTTATSAPAEQLAPTQSPSPPSAAATDSGSQNTQSEQQGAGKTKNKPPACHDAAWAQAITNHIRRFYPAAARGQRATGTATAHLVIRRSGWLNELEIVPSSDNGALDAAAYAMLRKAQPLPRIPDRIPADRIDLQLPITFGAGRSSKITISSCGP